MIRCKMQAHKEAGAIGSNISLNAVFEGSIELQKMSENSLFGDATPNGTCQLGHDAFDKIEEGEEYYIDMDPEYLPAVPYMVAQYWVRKAYRSQPYGDVVAFRFAEIGGRALNLQISVKNPAAIEALDWANEFHLRVSLARGGRRSDEEIALREKMLADFDSSIQVNASWKEQNPEGFAKHRAHLEKKIARAKGL